MGKFTNFRDDEIASLKSRMDRQEKEHVLQLQQLNKKMELVMDEKDHQLKVTSGLLDRLWTHDG